MGCAHLDDPRALANNFAGTNTDQLGMKCKAAIDKAANFDERTVERHGIGLVISSVLGPVGWAFNIARGHQYQNEKKSVAQNLKDNCAFLVLDSPELDR